MTLFSAWLLVLLFVCVGGVDERYSERLDVAAFGSCNKQHKPLAVLVGDCPCVRSLWLWTGDAVSERHERRIAPLRDRRAARARESRFAAGGRDGEVGLID